MHDVIKGDSNFFGVDKKGGFESNALPPTCGTDMFSLSDEEDDKEAEAQRVGGPRYSIMMDVSAQPSSTNILFGHVIDYTSDW